MDRREEEGMDGQEENGGEETNREGKTGEKNGKIIKKKMERRWEEWN